MLRLLLTHPTVCDTVRQESLFCYLFTTIMFWLSTEQKLRLRNCRINFLNPEMKQIFLPFQFLFSSVSSQKWMRQVHPNSFKSHGFHESKNKYWLNFLSTYRRRAWSVQSTFTVDSQFHQWFILRTDLFIMKNYFTFLQPIFNFSESPFIHLPQNFSLVQKCSLDTSPIKA